MADTDTSTYNDLLRDVSGLWWATLALGLLSVIAGIVVLIRPGQSLKTIAVIIGIFVLIDGISALLAALSRATENRGLMAIIGVLDLVIGVLLIRHPIGGVVAVAVLVGVWFIAMGAVRLVSAFDSDSHRFWRVLVAVVEIIAGIVVISSPKIGTATLALLVGLSLILNGLAIGGLGLALHAARREIDRPPSPQTPATT